MNTRGRNMCQNYTKDLFLNGPATHSVEVLLAQFKSTFIVKYWNAAQIHRDVFSLSFGAYSIGYQHFPIRKIASPVLHIDFTLQLKEQQENAEFGLNMHFLWFARYLPGKYLPMAFFVSNFLWENFFVSYSLINSICKIDIWRIYIYINMYIDELLTELRYFLKAKLLIFWHYQETSFDVWIANEHTILGLDYIIISLQLRPRD